MSNDEISVLRTENARLVALLEKHGIEWRQLAPPAQAQTKRVPELSKRCY
jgi:hypothetical protein